jgi:hypothetical protein
MFRTGGTALLKSWISFTGLEDGWSGTSFCPAKPLLSGSSPDAASNSTSSSADASENCSGASAPSDFDATLTNSRLPPVPAVASGWEAGGANREYRSPTTGSVDGDHPRSRARRSAGLAATAVAGAAGPSAERPLARPRCRQLPRSPTVVKGVVMNSKGGTGGWRLEPTGDRALQAHPRIGADAHLLLEEEDGFPDGESG